MATRKNDDAPGANGSPELGNPGADGGAGNDGSGNDSAGTIGGIPITSPASAGSAGPAGDAPRKRGRPAGSTSKSATREKAAPTTLKGIEKILFSMHTMVAGFVDIPEIEISKDESTMMAEAIAEVASHYNATLDPKALAWFGFAGAMGAVYGPRVAAFRMRKSMEKSNGKNPNNLSVIKPNAGPLVNGFPLPGVG